MKLKRVKALLADYYEGKTRREEERILTDFFMNNEVPESLEVDRQLFISLHESAGDEIPVADFDQKILAAIQKHEQQKDPAFSVQPGGLLSGKENKSPSKYRAFSTRRLVYTVSGIAASLLLLAGSYLLFVERQVHEIVAEQGREEYTMEEAMMAYEEARNALLLVSEVMNTGTGQLEALSKMTDATRELQIIDRFSRGADELQVLYKFEETREKILTKQ